MWRYCDCRKIVNLNPQSNHENPLIQSLSAISSRNRPESPPYFRGSWEFRRVLCNDTEGHISWHMRLVHAVHACRGNDAQHCSATSLARLRWSSDIVMQRHHVCLPPGPGVAQHAVRAAHPLAALLPVTTAQHYVTVLERVMRWGNHARELWSSSTASESSAVWWPLRYISFFVYVHCKCVSDTLDRNF